MASNREPWSGQQGWHVAEWGPWGWAETVVKLVAIVVAVVAAASDGRFPPSDGGRLSYWILALIAVVYVAAIGDRLIDREITAMAFVVLMVIGHLAAVHAVGRADWPTGFVRTFAGLMLVGDLIKLGYFTTTRTSVRGQPWTVPVALTAALALLYLITLLAA